MGSTANFDTEEFVTNTIEKCRICKVKLYITTYYCFEEIYLSYPELLNLNMNDGKNQELISTLKFVMDALKDNYNYFVKNDKTDYLFKIVEEAKYNREHMADALLMHSTRNNKNGYFEISKKKNSGITKCWLKDCKTLQSKQTKQIVYFCNNCRYCMCNSDSNSKMIDLLKKSYLIDNVNRKEYIELFAEKFA